MIAVFFLRWLSGYFEFTVSGKFPERFLNLAAKNGINLWNMNGQKGELRARAKIADYELLSDFARKTETEMEIIREYGFPYFCSKYKHRAGLLFGLLLGSILCVFLSGFVWRLEIHTPPGMSEYEIRNELGSLGLHEGTRMSNIDITDIEMRMKILDKRISWISINEIGTKYSVELTAQEVIAGEKKADKKTVSNFTAADDGIITTIKIRQGKSTVKSGEAVRQGQLIASGIVEYTDGSNLLSDCEGEIFAVTTQCTVFQLPKQSRIIQLSDTPTVKRELNILGIFVPVSLSPSPEGDQSDILRTYQLCFYDNDIPVILRERTLTPFLTIPHTVSPAEAKNILSYRKQLYETFMTAGSDKKVLKVSEAFSETADSFLLTVDYTIEKNICQKVYITIGDQNEEISNSGT